MKTWAIVAAVGAAGGVYAGSGAFLDVSAGTHEVVDGEAYAYVVARGDAVLSLSGGAALEETTVPLGAEHQSSAYGAGAVSAGLVATGEAQALVNRGRVARRVAALGRSNVWIGPDAEVRDALAHERGTLTLRGGHSAGVWFVESYGDSTVFVRDGLLEFGAFAHDRSLIAMAGGVSDGGVSCYNSARFVLSGGLVRGGVEGRDESRVDLSGGFIEGEAASAGASRVALSGGRVRAVRAASAEAFVMTGGSVVDDVNVETAFAISGGTVGGDIAGIDGDVRLDVRYVTYDHDGIETTPRVPLELDETGEAVLLPGDPRMRPVGGAAVEMSDVVAVWDDGSEAAFSIRGGDSETAWGGRVTFYRSAIPEDLNGDGGVDVLDLALFLGQFGGGPGSADFNNDGDVDVLDLVRFLQAWDV